MMPWIYLDKPSGIRSVQVLNIIKKKIKIKCGIDGILDEFACGLLPIALGASTKEINTKPVKKQYIFTIKWGYFTNTGDYTGQKQGEENHYRSNHHELNGIIHKFLGTISQIPPVYSNIKINGIRAHERARQGEVIIMKPRLVDIYDLQLLHLDENTTTWQVWVGSGTYIRSLAEDMVKLVGGSGHLIYLRRTKINIDGQDIIPMIDLSYFKD